MLDSTQCPREPVEKCGFSALGALLTMIKLFGVVASTVGCVSRPSPPPEANSKPLTEASSKPLTEHHESTKSSYPLESKRTLLQLARRALEQAVKGNRVSPPAGIDPTLLEQKGCFVTLTKQGQLRGCIGNIYPELPLAEAVATNAYRAALHDPRFSPVTGEELGDIEIEVSVLSVPKPLTFTSPEDLLQKLRPHDDGVVLEIDSHRATFLPQVWEKLPKPSDFLDQLSAKAGLARQAWRKTGTQILTYRVQAFTEAELHLGPRG